MQHLADQMKRANFDLKFESHTVDDYSDVKGHFETMGGPSGSDALRGPSGSSDTSQLAITYFQGRDAVTEAQWKRLEGIIEIITSIDKVGTKMYSNLADPKAVLSSTGKRLLNELEDFYYT